MTPQKHARQLTKIVLKNSEAKTIDKAFSEWSVDPYVDYDESSESECVCGKKHIAYLYRIRNTLNGNVLFPIGSKCIQRFGSSSMDFAVQSLQKIYDFTHGDRTGLSDDALYYLLQHEVIDNWEHAFLTGIGRKRNLSARQIMKISEVKSKVKKWFDDLTEKAEENTMKKKTTKPVKMNENVVFNEDEHRRLMKVNALEMARGIASRWMERLAQEVDTLRKKYKPGYPANVDQLVDEVQSTHNHIVAQCREEIANAGVGDYLTPEEVSLLMNEEMRSKMLQGKNI